MLPKPEQTALTSTGGLIPIYFQSSNKPTWEGQFVVDSETQFSFCLASPNANNYQIELQVPGDKLKSLKYVLKKYNGRVFEDHIGISSDYLFPVTCYEFPVPKQGLWDVVVSASVNSFISKKDLVSLLPSGYFIVYNESPYKVSAFTSENLIFGESLALNAKLVDKHGLTVTNLNNTKSATSTIAAAVVIEPDGTEKKIQLRDDGLGGDLSANDGLYTGHVTLDEVGSYKIDTTFSGVTPEGKEFFRSVQDVVTVVQSTLKLTSNAIATDYQDSEIKISIEVNGKQDSATSYLAFAQVWGTGSNGEEVPVAWISGMARPEEINGNTYLSLLLNKKWISMSKAAHLFTLKNVRVQDGGFQIVLSEVNKIIISSFPELPQQLYSQEVTEISEEMRNGRRPEKFQKRLTASKGKVLLIHGYCSDANAWSGESFTDYAIFKDPNANRNLDEFAKLILDFAKSQNIEAFSAIGHSQGGLASLHLASYFWSGLDLVGDGRIIQSIGSPYQGTALAGGLASIGGVFGVGCGSNEGLTKSGASKWLSGIPSEKQQLVHYYTTEGKKTCSTSANWLGLDKPNDGVTSKNFSQLPNGNNQGHYVGWCHVSDMTDPAQTFDSARNAEMNRLAAR